VDKDFGAYELRDRIGKGGMAWVYLATQKNLDRPVALKILFPHLAEDEKLVARFQLEARSAAQMRHENVCQVYDFGRHGEQFYIAMEYVEGLNLREWIDTKGTPPLEIALLMLRDICRGLEHAHRRNIIHRDIKPSNVMFTPEGVIKLMDFGLARRAEETTGITMVGSMLGTPAYMSPEQARGEKLDRATTDIFSFGIVCYELLSGSRPFQGDTSSIARAILYAEPRPLDALDPLVPPGVEAMIRSMLEKDANLRVQSVTMVRQAFDQSIAALGISHERGLLGDYAADPEGVGAELRAKRLARHLENVREAEARGDQLATLREYRCVAFLDPTHKGALAYLREHDVPWPPARSGEDLDHTVLLPPEPETVVLPPGGASRAGTSVPPPSASMPPASIPPASMPPASMPPGAPPSVPPAPPAAAPSASAADPGAPAQEYEPKTPVWTEMPDELQTMVAPPDHASAVRGAPPASPVATAGRAPSGDEAPPAKKPASAKPAPPAARPRAAKSAGPPAGLLIGGAVALAAVIALMMWQPWKPREPQAVVPEAASESPALPEEAASDGVELPAAPLTAILNVVTLPPDATVSLDGGAFVPAPARFADLEPRDHTVRIRRDSFQVARRVVPLAAGRETTLTIALKPAVAGAKRLAALIVQTEPRDATVRLDGEHTAAAPARFRDLAEGEHTVEVSREGYETRTIALLARAGAESTLTVALSPARRAGVAPRTVTIRTQPRGGMVSLNGSPSRREPAKFEGVGPGQHVVRGRLGGSDDRQQAFALTGLRDTTILLRLGAEPIEGPTATLVVWARPPADFYVERELRGSGLDSIRVTVPANKDQHVHIRETSPWFGISATNTVRAKPGEVKYVGRDFTTDGGRVDVDTPGRPGAEVLVDGRPTGRRTPATLYVSSGQHKIHVQVEGWKTREGEQTVRFKGGQARQFSFTLEAE